MKTVERPWWSRFGVVDGITVIHVDLTPDPRSEREAATWLDRPETERMRRFRVERPRRDFALCRAALRANLCGLLDCTNDRLSFGFHEHGKPFAQVEGRAAPLGFNVSHSAPHGLIAFAPRERPRRRIGVDAEVWRPDRDFDGIGRTVFGPEERAALEAARGRGQDSPVLPALGAEGGAHQGAGHRILPPSVPIRGPAEHDSRGRFGGVPLPACAGGPLAARLPARGRVFRRPRPRGGCRPPVRALLPATVRRTPSAIPASASRRCSTARFRPDSGRPGV